MTKKEAKELTIKVWEWLRDNPSAKFKGDVPDKLFKQIQDLYHDCPLCGLFNKEMIPFSKWESHNCEGCPLKAAGQQCDSEGENYFTSWNTEECGEAAEAIRRTSATGIVDIVKCWKIEE